MTASGWDEDDDLLEQLRAAVRQAGEPTPAMVAAASAALSWASVDAELAALTHDSLVEETAGVRGGSSGPRGLVFEGEQVSVELEQDPDCLIGQLVPPTPGEVALLHPGGNSPVRMSTSGGASGSTAPSPASSGSAARRRPASSSPTGFVSRAAWLCGGQALSRACIA